MHLNGRESAAERFKALAEFRELNSSVAVKVEVLENTLAGLAFIIGTMGTLANFLENDIADSLETSRVHAVFVSHEAPSVNNNLSEVSLTFSGKHNVHERVVDAELLLVNAVSTGSARVNAVAEGSEDSIGLLLAREYTWVLVSTVVSFKFFNREAISTAGNLSPGTLDNSKASVAHVSAHALDEFVV